MKLLRTLRNFIQNKQGLTLVEMIVVILLIMIILGVSAGGLLAYMDWSQYKEQNDAAQSLFLAAQAQLTQYGQRGQLDQFAAQTGHAELDLENLIGRDGQPVDAATIWETDDADYQGKLCYLIGTPSDYQDYQRYMMGELDSMDPQLVALYDIFDSYLYDKAVLQATICLEFDPWEGLVYAVLYSTHQDGFSYSAGATGSIQNRTSAALREGMIGYYGVDSLSKSTLANLQRPSIQNLQLVNAEQLYLSFRIGKNAAALPLMQYEVLLYDAATDKLRLRILFNDTSLCEDPSRDTGNYLLVAADATVTHTVEAEVTYYDAESGNASTPVLMTFPASVSDGDTIQLVLDAIDQGASFTRYVDYKKGVSTEFLHTYSFLRFDLDVEDIYCTVQGYSESFLPTAQKRSNKAHSLFAGYTAAEEDLLRGYDIANARHLNNIRFIESNLDQAATQYRVKADFAWDSTIAAGLVYRDFSLVRTGGEFGRPWVDAGAYLPNQYKDNFSHEDLLVQLTPADLTNLEQAFVSIPLLKEDSLLFSQKSGLLNLLEPCMISGLIILEEANLAAEISEQDVAATGLFFSNLGTISGLHLDRITVSGGDYVGAFCGINTGTLSNLAVLDSAVDSSPSTISGKQFVGGIAGTIGRIAEEDENENEDVLLEALINHATVAGEQAVGGILGSGVLASPEQSLRLVNCESQGTVMASDRYVGGILGYSDGAVVENCTTLGSVAGGDFAGGIVGYHRGVLRYAAENPQNRQVVVQPAVSGGDFVGGIVGYNTTEASISSYQLRGGSVVGKRFVGGFAGLNAAQSLFAENQKISAAPDLVRGEYFVGGVLGGNVVALDSSLALQCDISHLQGQVFGQALVGGFIGYNLSLAESEQANIGTITEQLLALTPSGIADAGSYVQMLQGLQSLSASASPYLLTINGSRVHLGELMGQIYVGGVIGYQHHQSYLHIKNVTNQTPITTTMGVASQEQGANDMRLYSYAGGITGKVSDKMVVENCTNGSQGVVTSAGDYTGGLVEINKGLIFNCTAASISNVAASYVGGLVGVNVPSTANTIFADTSSFVGQPFYVNGTTISLGIYNCTFSGSLAGQGNVGGIAAENKGLIYGPLVQGSIQGDGHYIGGVAGYNYANGTIELLSTVNVNISGNGTYVGGVIGCNAGSLLLSGTAVDTVTTAESTVQGQLYVGGIFGQVAPGTTIADMNNSATVVATQSYAGGIVGNNEAAGTISGCINYGSVRAERGNAGGIAGGNQGSILSCSVQVAASIPLIEGSENVGGIVGLNNGAVSEASFDGEVYAASNSSGALSVGGIAGRNQPDGIVSDCVVGPLTNTDIKTIIQSDVAANLGGLVGWNQGQVVDCDQLRNSDALVSVVGQTGYIGGLIGLNTYSAQNTVRDSSTGVAWIVIAEAAARDNATAGIIGCNESSQEFVNLHNMAGVYNISDQTSAIAGGVIGLQNSTSGTAFVLADCDNEGPVWSAGIAGGLVGSWQNQGGSIRNRSQKSSEDYYGNRAPIGVASAGTTVYYVVSQTEQTFRLSSKTPPTVAAGLVANISSNTRNAAISVTNAANFGNVYGSSDAAGAIAYVNAPYLQLSLAELVNTGTMLGTSQTVAAGILNRVDRANTVEIFRARNYGVAAHPVDAQEYAGIANNAVARTQDCFDYSNSAIYPIVRDENSGREDRYDDSYYVDAGVFQATDPDRVYIENATLGRAGDRESDTQPLSNSYDMDPSTEAHVLLASEAGTNNPAIITWELYEPTTLTGFGFQWGVNSTTLAARYRFKMYYQVEGSSNWVEVANDDSYRDKPMGAKSTYHDAWIGGTYSHFEVGYPASRIHDSVYYHAFNATNVVKIKVEINGMWESKNTSNWDNHNGWDFNLPTYNTWNGRTTVVLRDTFATKSGRLTSANLDDRRCASGGGAIQGRAQYGTPLFHKGSSGNWLLQAPDGMQISDLANQPYWPPPTSASERYQRYLELEEKLSAYYAGKYNSGTAPSSVVADDIGGAFQVDWSGGSGYRFELTYRVVKNGQTLVDYGDVLLPATASPLVVSSRQQWVGGTIQFRVRAVYFAQGAMGYEETATGWTTSNALDVKQTLPAPEVHLQLIDGAGNYNIVLANSADYPANTQISFALDGTVYSFAAASGSYGPISLPATKQYEVVVEATNSSADYGKSPTVALQAMLYSQAALTTMSYIDTSLAGVFGTSAQDLQLQVVYYGYPDASFNTFTELLAYDSAIGAEVAVAAQQGFISSQSGILVLADLPAEVFAASQVQVRTYPWSTQANLSQYGYLVADGISAADVQALGIVQGGSLANGYTVQRYADGTYCVLYSSILANSASYSGQIGTFMVDLSPQQPAPLLEAALASETVDGVDYYTFTWDKGLGYADASYQLTLTGITAAGSRVQLSPDSASYADSSWSVRYADTGSLSYAQFELAVERIGSADEAGETTLFPAYGSAIYAVPQRFPTIGRPTASLYQYSGGDIERYSLLYEVRWTGLSDAAQLAELDSYEITVVDEDDNSAVYSIPADKTTATINLNSFAPGAEVRISVRAIATDTATGYRNGSAGTARTLTLTDLPLAPEMDAAAAGSGYGLLAGWAAMVDEADFASLTISMTAQTAATAGGYELVASVVDAPSANAAVLETLSTKADPLSMSGSLADASYTFSGLDTAHAGQYLRIVLRSTLAGNASSWTDAAAESVTEVYYLQLPELQLSEPEPPAPDPPTP